MSAPDATRALGALLELGRVYATARSEGELALAFCKRAPEAFGASVKSIALLDPTTLTVRAYDADGEALPTDASIRVRPPLRSDVDVRGWTLDADAGAIPGVFESRLWAAVEIVPDVSADGALAIFLEQLAEAATLLAERSETARLRLYAGSIVTRSNVPIAIVDREGRIRLSNAALRGVFPSADPEDSDDGALLARISDEDRLRVLRAHAKAVRGSPSHGVEIGTATGASPRRLVVDFEPIVGSTGTVDSVLLVGRDVTRVRQLEDQVSHADRLAVVGQLAAGVVHELNNPLTSILVYSEFVLRRAESRGDEQDAEKLRRIVHAADRIQRFAKNLITYARTERGEREPLSVTQVADEALAFCEPILGQRNVTVIREYGSSLPEIAAVRGQLQQIFINLLTNAVHAVRPGEGRVRVNVRSEQAAYVLIDVEDNGPGVPETLRGEVFRPFMTTKPSGEGTGLGLSIVRNLVERHGGTVTILGSSLGGACFRVHLPIKPPSERPPPLPE